VLEAALEKLGDEGWELVSVHVDVAGRRYIFKRPIIAELR
jgi:hypothetical protein